MYIEISTVIVLAIFALIAYFEYRSLKGEPVKKFPAEIQPYVLFVRNRLCEYQSSNWAKTMKIESINYLEKIYKRYKSGLDTGIDLYDEYCRILMTQYNDDGGIVKLWGILFMYSKSTSPWCSDAEKAFRHQLVQEIEKYSPEEIPASFYEIFPLSRFFPNYEPSQINK